MSKKNTPFAYEEALAQLQSLQEALAKGEVPLAELQQRLAQATDLVNRCKSALRTTEESLERFYRETDDEA